MVVEVVVVAQGTRFQVVVAVAVVVVVDMDTADNGVKLMIHNQLDDNQNLEAFGCNHLGGMK